MALWTWIASHQALVAGALVGILDLLFAINPKWQSNGILHWILLQAQKISNGGSGPSAPVPPTPPSVG